MKMLSDNLHCIIPSVLVLLVLVACYIYIQKVKKMKNPSTRHWSSIPGFCMGVGIAATFISLFITFQRYEEGKVLSTLIKEVSGAFLGSLVGLGYSLYMTFKIKSKITEIEAEEQKAAGEENNPYKLLQQIVTQTSATVMVLSDLRKVTTNDMSDLKNTIETLLNTNNRHLVDIKEGANNNKSSIDGLKSEFVRLLDINNDELKSSKKILKDFTDKTEQFNANLFNELIEKLEKAVRDMSNEAITKSLGNLENINNDLSKNLKTVFSDTGNTITQGQSDLKGSIEDLKSFFEGAIKEMNDAANQSTKVTQESVNHLLSEISDKIVKMGENIVKQADAVIAKKEESINNTFSAIDEKQRNAVQVQSDIVEKMKSVFEDMQTAFNTKISEINTATSEIQGKIIDMGNNITDKADKIVDAKIQSLEETFKRIEEYQTRSQNALETATKSFKETVEKYEQVNEDKTELIRIIGQQLTELEEVRKNGTTLIQNWNDIAKTMEQMQDRISQINRVITQLDNIKTVLLNQQN